MCLLARFVFLVLVLKDSPKRQTAKATRSPIADGMVPVKLLESDPISRQWLGVQHVMVENLADHSHLSISVNAHTQSLLVQKTNPSPTTTFQSQGNTHLQKVPIKHSSVRFPMVWFQSTYLNLSELFHGHVRLQFTQQKKRN